MQLITMIKNQLKLLFNNRIAILAIVAAPLLLTYLFSFTGNSGKTNLYTADSDKSTYSKQLISMIKKHKDINIINISESDMTKKINNGSITMGLVINKNFSSDLTTDKKLNMKIIQNYETSDSALLEQVILNEANTLKKVTTDSKIISGSLNLSNSSVSKELLKKVTGSLKVTTSDKSLSKGQKNEDTTATKLIGFLIMFLWFVIVQGFRTLIQEKENDTFNRILGMPTNYTKYLISKIVSTYIFGLIVTAIILVAGKYIFNLNLAGNFAAEGVIYAVYLFALTGIVMIFVPFIKKQQTFTILGAVIMALTGILGGSFFSIDEIASDTMKLVSKFTPEAWAIKSITNITFNNAALSSETSTIIVLTAVGVLALTISYILLTLKLKTERA